MSAEPGDDADGLADPTAAADHSRYRYPRGTEEFGRFLSFTDGVVAIALTLLVLGIDVPRPRPGQPDPDVLTMIGDLWPQIFAFLLSFVIIAFYWFHHHRFSSELRAIDGPMILWNFAFLLLIAFMPLISQVMGFYGDDQGAVVLYATWFVAFGLVDCIGYWTAWKRDLFQEEPSPAKVRFMFRVRLAPPAMFLLSIPVAYFVSVNLATLSWLLLYPLMLVVRRGDPER